MTVVSYGAITSVGGVHGGVRQRPDGVIGRAGGRRGAT